MTPVVAEARELVTFRVAEQWFGVPVLAVQEVLVAQRVARVPLSSPEITGLLNLRGQIVTAINLHRRMQLGTGPEGVPMNVVVRDGEELFALVVDEVGDVVPVPDQAFESVPPTLDTCWKGVCVGVVQRESDLLAVLDPHRVLTDSTTSS
jgi:purine-binding chemotaxis protein CheW